jgi:hypothetical protein
LTQESRLTCFRIFFIITTAISSYYLIKFRKEGHMPYQSAAPNPHHTTGDAGIGGGKDNTWSTEIDQNRDSFDNDDARTERGGNQEEDEYALLNSTETEEGRHPGRPLSWGENRYEAEPAPPYAGYQNTASALSPSGYEEYRSQTAGQPEYQNQGYGAGGRGYGADGRGYSFGGGDRV